MSLRDVVFVLPSLERGGAERVAVNLMNGLAEEGVRVGAFIVADAGPLAKDLSGSIELTALGLVRVRDALPRIIRALRQRSPDVIITTHTHVNLAMCAARPLLPRRSMLVLREPIHAPIELEGRSTRPVRLAQRALYRRSDAVLSSSAESAQDLAALTGARVVRIENPVDVAGVRAAARRPPDEPLGRRGVGRDLLCIGRLVPQKAMQDLIEAFARGADPADTLTIVGEGPERTRLEQLVVGLGLTGRVTLPGQHSDPWVHLSRADALVLASRAEGMPNVVLEALALGTPVITTDDLVVLEELAREVGSEHLRLVPRSELFRALASVEARAMVEERTSQLPERFDRRAVAATLLETLVRIRAGT